MSRELTWSGLLIMLIAGTLIALIRESISTRDTRAEEAERRRIRNLLEPGDRPRDSEK